MEFTLAQQRHLFQCPICLTPITYCVVIPTCMHRFCSACVHKCLRVQAGEGGKGACCPSCRVSVPTSRLLRRDERVDRIVALLFPQAGDTSSWGNLHEEGGHGKEENVVEKGYLDSVASDRVSPSITLEADMVLAESVASLNHSLALGLARQREQSKKRKKGNSCQEDAGQDCVNGEDDETSALSLSECPSSSSSD